MWQQPTWFSDIVKGYWITQIAVYKSGLHNELDKEKRIKKKIKIKKRRRAITTMSTEDYKNCDHWKRSVSKVMSKTSSHTQEELLHHLGKENAYISLRVKIWNKCKLFTLYHLIRMIIRAFE